VRNVDGSCARGNDSLNHLAEKRDVRAGGIFGRELNVSAQRLRVAHSLACLFQAPLARDTQLELEMNVGSRKENVNARMSRALQCLPGAVDIGLASARQASNDRAAH